MNEFEGKVKDKFSFFQNYLKICSAQNLKRSANSLNALTKDTSLV